MDTLKDGTILDKDQTKAYNPERLKTKDRKMVSFREQKRFQGLKMRVISRQGRGGCCGVCSGQAEVQERRFKGRRRRALLPVTSTRQAYAQHFPRFSEKGQ